MGKEKKLRGIIDPAFLEKFSGEGEYRSMIDKVNDPENGYWLGIRHETVMLYYMGGKILEITPGRARGLNENYFRYLDGDHSLPSDDASSVEERNIREELSRRAIENCQKSKKEKKAQQEILLKNNRDKKAEWFLVDMEYSVSGLDYGRFDLIALSRVKDPGGKYRIALIELKCGTDAFSGGEAERDDRGNVTGFARDSKGRPKYGSGVAGHVINFYKFLYEDEQRSAENMERLASEISTILGNYSAMGIQTPFHNLCADEIDTRPDHVCCWLMCVDIKEGQRAAALKKAKHHLFDDPADRNTSKLCLEKWMKNFDQEYGKLHLQICLTDKGGVLDSGAFIPLDRNTVISDFSPRKETLHEQEM